MRTTSQSEQETSKHPAQKPNRKSDRATRPDTALPRGATPNGTHRPNQIFRRAETLIKPAIVYLVFAALGALAVGLVSHFTVVVPLEKSLLSAEARSLATDMDSTVRMRSSLISTAVGNSELDGFLEAGGLDKLLSALRKHFPDFLSVEATNDRGQIQAMGGELPLSQASSFSRDPSGKTSTVNLGIQHNKGIFHDDPENNCFIITCRHIGSEGGKWFTRSRFSRASVVPILESAPTRRVTLVPISGVSKDIPEGQISLSRPESCVVRTVGSLWYGPTGAEALITMPGWLMRMENTAKRPILWRSSIAVPLCLLLCTVLAGILLRPAPLQDSHAQDLAQESATGGQSAAQDEKRDTEPKFCERSASLTENSGEMSLPVGKIHSPLQSEAEFDKPASMQEFASTRRDDPSCLTKIVTIPGGTSSVDATGNRGQEQRADDSMESEPLPETLEVCWVEPSDHCETGHSPFEEKSECTRPFDEEEGLGSERSPAGGHLLSAGG